MTGTADDRYLEWLYGLVGSVRNKNPASSRWHLLREMYRKPFLWFVANDDNRIADALEVRLEFAASHRVEDDWLDLPCSFLEMLIALSRRMEFETTQPALEWFWHLLENIELHDYTDDVHHSRAIHEINQALDCVIFRNYHPNGRGGLFPLSRAHEDQRRIELWYQMSAYLLERSN